MKTQLSERVGVLEKWRWLIIGGSIIIGLMMSNIVVIYGSFLTSRMTFANHFVIMYLCQVI